jgi:CRISPR system Cascade subunit CasE
VIQRGDIRWFRFTAPDKRRPVLVLGRPDLLPSLAQVPVIPLSTQARGLERLRWLSRRAEAAGFTIEDGQIRITEIATSGGRGGKSVTFGGALFEGILVVRDADLFPKALASGIGPAKAYGFGLLSIVKAP